MKQQTKITLIIVSIVIVTALGIGVYWLATYEEDNQAPYSAENQKETGIQAIRELYQMRGYETGLWKQKYDQLPNTTQNMLMIVNPQVKQPNEAQIQHIENWVAQGNRVILWAPVDSEWTKVLRFHGFSCKNTIVKQVTHFDRNPWLSEVKQLNWPSGGCVQPAIDQVNLLVDQQSSSLLVKRRIGQGEVYYIPETELLTNGQIREQDHLYLLLAVAEWGKGTIWFDESVHPWPPPANPNRDNKDPQTTQSPKETPPPPSFLDMLNIDGWILLWQLILLILLFLYLRGKRFAAPRLELQQTKRNAIEFVQAMGKWAQRTKSRSDVVADYQQKLSQALYQILRLPKNISQDEMQEKVRQYIGEDYHQRLVHWSQFAANLTIKKSIPLLQVKQLVFLAEFG